MNRKTGPANSDSLLADLCKISGLPLEELQFLGKAGLLRTHLRKIPAGQYTVEEWNIGLAVLYDRRMAFTSLEEVHQWLNSSFMLPVREEREERLCEENGS